jgi:hypothetical protein
VRDHRVHEDDDRGQTGDDEPTFLHRTSITRLGILAWLAFSLPARSDTAVPGGGLGVRCETVGDCWLDAGGKAIKRPARFRRKPIPRGDCGKNLLWLRHILSCEQNRCVSQFIGDKC